MKHYTIILTLAVLIATLASVFPVPVQANPAAVDEGGRLYAQNSGFFQSSSDEGAAVFGPQDGAGDLDAQPQGEVRSVLPLFFLIIIYFIIRRMYKNMGSGDDNPFSSGRDFDDRSSPRSEEDPDHLKDAYDNARKMWDTFNARPGKDVPAGPPRPVSGAGAGDAPAAKSPRKVLDINAKVAKPAPKPQTPSGAGQDAGDEEFLMGAQLVFERIVEAVDGLDLDMAAHFVGPGVLNEIKHRINEGHPPATSEVVRVDAKVLSRTVEQGTVTVTVYYDGVKRVSGIGPIGPVQVREIWTFTKDDNDPAAMWMLQSMEPVEA